MSSTLTKRHSPSSALMAPPPPPPKRIKRPPKVLDEDEYTDALSQIIARDYFPGLLESKAQQDYLNALESKNAGWIADAGNRLREAMTPGPHTRGRRSRAARNSRFDTAVSGDSPWSRPAASATPHGFTGDETPASSTVAETEDGEKGKAAEMDRSSLSLSAFQSKYTSEDNESFNALLDKQNSKRRQKHGYLWAGDQRIPSARQIAHRDRQARLDQQRADDQAAGRELIPITVGAGEDRPAQPDSWKIKRPDNTFMFPANSVEDDGLETIAEANQHASRAGAKGVVYANTRLRPPPLSDRQPGRPSSPPLSAIQDAIGGHPRLSASEVLDLCTANPDGGDETPRIKGYAFVDEDEPENTTAGPDPDPDLEPTYGDLLAGQAGDGTANPFQIGQMRRREHLHHRLVERQARKKRTAHTSTSTSTSMSTIAALKGANMSTPRFASSPMLGRAARSVVVGGDGTGLTPAARRLFDRLGRTPVHSSAAAAAAVDHEQREAITTNTTTGNAAAAAGTATTTEKRPNNMWTPTPTSKAKMKSMSKAKRGVDSNMDSDSK